MHTHLHGRIGGWLPVAVLPALLVIAPAAAQHLAKQFPTANLNVNILEGSRGGVTSPENVFKLQASTPDYRWEGLAIGAISIGVFGAIAGSQLCHLSDSANQHCLGTSVGLGLLGAVAGGVVGGLIGGTIPKVPIDSTR